MSRKNLEAFREFVWSDEAQLRLLREIKDRSAFETCVLEMGRAAGYDFDGTDVSDLMRENRLIWLQRSL
jgi:hypothetical protein